MEGVERKETLDTEYPKLKVMLSPENDNEESDFDDSEDVTRNLYAHHSDKPTVEELAQYPKSPIYNEESFGSSNKIKVDPNDAPHLGLASLVSSPTSNDSSTTQRLNPTTIDTKAPIESVKDVVSKFGGIVDWKAHRERTAERRKLIEIELEKAQEEIPIFRKECEALEEQKTQILKNLDITNTIIEDMKLKLEREQIEEQQAKQDSDYAKLKVEELEKGIDTEATISAKAQLAVAKARHLAALSELKIVKDEFEKLHLEFSALAADRDAAIKKAEEDIAKSQELERKIEDLTIQISNTKGYLESVHAENLEGEECRVGPGEAFNEEMLKFEKELKEAENNLERLLKETSRARDLKLKLDESSTLEQCLKDELATYYIKSKSNKENDDVLHSADKLEKREYKTHNDVLDAISSVKKELEKVEAHKELRKAIEEANQEKALASSMTSRLLATQKEIEATKYFEKYALTTINNEDSSHGAILSLDQYLELNQQAHEANASENNSQQRLREINHEIIQRKKTLQIALQKAEIAKEGKLKVEEQWRNMRAGHDQRETTEPEVVNAKSQTYESIESNGGQNEDALYRQRSPRTTEAPTAAQTRTQSEIDANYKEILSLETSTAKKKKKSIFPKFWMFMGKKKTSS